MIRSSPGGTTRRAVLGAAAAGASVAASVVASVAAIGGASMRVHARETAPSPGKPAAQPSNPVAVPLAGPALLEAFMKLRAATDGRIVVGWMDALTYTFIEGETFPLYRLFAATWYRFRRTSPDRYDGVQLEIATFHDVVSGEPLTKLTMPRTGEVVDVPRYRAGPSQGKVVLSHDEETTFGMARETQQGSSFFRQGRARSRAWVSQPERDGDTFMVREDLDTRVVQDDAKVPGFFYREWSTRRAPWANVMNPRIASVDCEVLYTGMAAFRPWMKMTGIPGHTVQNGRGGKVDRFDALPARVQQICRQWHPDLVADPGKVLDKA
jgi:hypothetical protein